MSKIHNRHEIEPKRHTSHPALPPSTPRNAPGSLKDRLEVQPEDVQERSSCWRDCLRWIGDFFAAIFRCLFPSKNRENRIEGTESSQVLSFSAQGQDVTKEPAPTAPPPKKELVAPEPDPTPPPPKKELVAPEPDPKFMEEMHAFAVQFMQDFYWKAPLLGSESALEKFQRADPRAQDWILYYLTKQSSFSFLFKYISNLPQKEGRKEVLHDLIQNSKFKRDDSLTDPNNVTHGQTLWMMKVFRKGIPSWSTYAADKSVWIVNS